MPPKKAASLKITSPSEEYKAIGKLLKYNVELLPEGELVDDTLFKTITHKETGMTVGKIVSLETDETADFLLKKSGRYYSEDDRNTKDLSRDMSPEDLLKGIKESFNEKCAAELFNILKGQNDYLPEFWLVKSIFNTDKPHNRLKRNTEAFKVYIASKIIGDRSKVNAQTNGIDHLRLLDPEAVNHNKVLQPETPEIIAGRERLKDDLLENAVIMILLSNYDIKLDNFVHDKETMIPIDFGNAKAEEELSPDVIDGIDLIRRSRGKTVSDQYASRSMKERFSRDNGYLGTQSFYNRNLQPKHFLGVIEKIKSNQDAIEEGLYQTAYQYTFGTQEEKEQYAEVLVARVRNLVALEPVFISQLDSTKPFGQQNLRNLVANNSEFQLDLREGNWMKQANPSEGKIFFKTTCELFASLKQEQEAILAKLQDFQDLDDVSAKEEPKQKIISNVAQFNESLAQKYKEFQKQFILLEEKYRDSEYISGKNTLRGDDSWEVDKKNISVKIMEVFETLNVDLIGEEEEEELSYKFSDVEINFDQSSDGSSSESYLVSKGSSSQNSDVNSSSKISESESDSSSEDEEESQEDEIKNNSSESEENINKLENSKIEWDLTKADQYIEKLKESIEYTQIEYRKIEGKMLRLLSHLRTHETLMEVKKEKEIVRNFEVINPTQEKSTTPKPSFRSIGTSAKIIDATESKEIG